MQAIIPQFVVDNAIELCRQTLENSLKGEDIEVTKAKMLAAFRKLAEWITEEDLGAVCGKDFEHLSVKDIVKLRNLYNAINDGFVKPEVAFKKETESTVTDDKAADALASVNELFGGSANASANEG